MIAFVIPLQMHVFLWHLSNNNLLTRDNLTKRKETIKHVFSAVNRRKQFADNIFGKDIEAGYLSVAIW
jgi:hypothetical protein